MNHWISYYLLLSVLQYVFPAEGFELPAEPPKCLTREFSQRKIRYGNLERDTKSGGLFFQPQFPTESLAIYYRLHLRSFNGRDRYAVTSASTLSFARSLDMLSQELRDQTDVNIFLSTTNEDDILKLSEWSEMLFKNRTRSFRIYKCPSGNSESFLCMLQTINRQAFIETFLSLSTIVYLLEDDYLHHASATQELVDIFSSHDPCFAVPYDYADRYSQSNFNDDDGKITIVAGKNRHWRTVRSITCSYAARLHTLLHIMKLNMLPHPLNDYFMSMHVVDMGGTILSPLPGLSAHVEYYYQDEVFDFDIEMAGLYFDWCRYGRELVEYIKLHMFEKSFWGYDKLYDVVA